MYFHTILEDLCIFDVEGHKNNFLNKYISCAYNLNFYFQFSLLQQTLQTCIFYLQSTPFFHFVCPDHLHVYM